MAVPRIRHLAIRSRDVERSVRFYRDGLGFQIIGPRGAAGQAMDLSDQTLNVTILPFQGPINEPAEEGSEQIHFGIIVPDAKALFVRLRDMGILSARYDIKERHMPEEGKIPDGSYKVIDPDGNVIDVTDSETEWRGISATR